MTNRGTVPPPGMFFLASGTGNSPWEIERPQPAIVKLVKQGIFQGEVLDIGCGIGDNAIYISAHTENVRLTAIDLVPRAVEVAYEKAKGYNANIRFEVVDMLDNLSRTNLRPYAYDVILDAGVFHSFSNDDRQGYIKNLEYLIKPGGLYIQLCFSEQEIREGGPRRIKVSDLHQLFSVANGWTIELIENSVYQLKPGVLFGADGRAYLSFIRRNKYA